MKKIIISLVTLIISTTIYTSKECIVFSSGADSEHPDYKVEQHIECHCPCRQYKMLPRGECSYCGHYRYPSHWYIMRAKKQRFKKHCPQVKETPMTTTEKLKSVFGEHITPEMDN